MANGKEVDTEAVFQSILGIANRVLEKSEMKDNELYEQYENSAQFIGQSHKAASTVSRDFCNIFMMRRIHLITVHDGASPQGEAV